MTTETTITIDGIRYTATLDGEQVSISQDGAWAGDGRYVDGRIVDCPARLGPADTREDASDGAAQETSERIYEAIEDALTDATTTRNAATWVTKGQGATLGELFALLTSVEVLSFFDGDDAASEAPGVERAAEHLDLVALALLSGAERDEFFRGAVGLRTGIHPRVANLRTNLVLSPGVPLSANDLHRIAQAEV